MLTSFNACSSSWELEPLFSAVIYSFDSCATHDPINSLLVVSTLFSIDSCFDSVTSEVTFL